jgi:hypothetical protein
MFLAGACYLPDQAMFLVGVSNVLKYLDCRGLVEVWWFAVEQKRSN